MSTALLNRLDRLEQRLLPSLDASVTIWVRFDHPEDVGAELGVRSAVCDGRTFVRTTDESLSAFRDRIDAETQLPESTVNVRVVILYGDADELSRPGQGAMQVLEPCASTLAPVGLREQSQLRH